VILDFLFYVKYLLSIIIVNYSEEKQRIV